MAYALGRRVEYFDQPAIRAIAKAAEANDYKMSSFILGRHQERRVSDEAAEPSRTTSQTVRRTVRVTRRRNMNFITGKHLPRRTFLRGMGATVALAVPRRDGARRPDAARRPRPPSRRGWSASRRCTAWPAATTGARRKFLFAPETTGRDFTLVPDNPLSTLERVPRPHDDRQQHRRAQWPRRSRCRKSAATTSARARCS